MNNYKVIDIDNEKLSKEEIKNLLYPIFNNYKNTDIYFETDVGKIKIFLRSLNYKKFQKDIQSCMLNKSEEESALLVKILENINSIKSFGIKSDKRIYVDYNKERKVINRKEKELKRLSSKCKKLHEIVEPNRVAPKEFVNKIICADSLKALKKIPNNCIDLIFTSPPYNFGLDYSNNTDDKKWENYFEQLFLIFDECIRILKNGGRFIINIQPLFSDYIPSHHIVSNYLLNKKMLWKGEIIWEKNNYNCKYTAWGSWKSPSSPYLKYTWEFVEIFAKNSLKKDGEKENIDISADEFKKWVVAKWSIAPERSMKKFDHPAMFPEELATRVIKLFSFKNDVILDPFNGVGTTTFVAKNLERKFIGIDISKEYCKKAKKRLEENYFGF